MAPQPLLLQGQIPPELAGQRLDQALVALFPDYSRARLQSWIREGAVLVDGRGCRPRDPAQEGARVVVQTSLTEDSPWQAEALPITVVYQDDALLVVDKPAGLVVHPAAGNYAGTLVNALLHFAPELAAVPRAGLVHRLDKDTTGLLVVARTLTSHCALVAQLKERAFLREYQAVVNGELVAGGTVDAPLGRHPQDRKRMAVVASGRPAITHYRIATRFPAHTHLTLRLETGRTHQIRVHLSHIRYPLVGDPVYGGRPRLPPGCSGVLAERLQQFPRQALHAAQLGLTHPVSGAFLTWQSPLPADMATLLAQLGAG